MAKTSTGQSESKITVGKTWFWATQIASVIGLISIIDDLKLWIETIAWVLAKLGALLPAMADLLVAIGGVIDSVLSVFRGIFRPIVEFLLQWLPWPIPEWVKDGLVVAAFVGLGLLRTSIRYQREWEVVNEEENDRLLEALSVAGIPCESVEVYDVRGALEDYGQLNHAGFSGDEEVTAEMRKRWSEALVRHGPGFEAFAAANWQDHPFLSPRKSHVFDREDRAKIVVWSLGGFTAILVLIDIVFVR